MYCSFRHISRINLVVELSLRILGISAKQVSPFRSLVQDFISEFRLLTIKVLTSATIDIIEKMDAKQQSSFLQTILIRKWQHGR